MVLVAWVVFRAKNLGDAGYVLSHWFSNWNFQQISTQQFQLKQLPAALAAILILEAVQRLRSRVSPTLLVARAPVIIRWAAYASFVYITILFGIYRKAQFIYFQF